MSRPVRLPLVVTAVDARWPNPFSKLKPETSVEVPKAPLVVQPSNGLLDELISALMTSSRYDLVMGGQVKRRISEIASKCSPQTILELSLMISPKNANERASTEWGDKVGEFFSILISNCPSQDLIVNTYNIQNIRFFASENTKNVRIIGNAGYGVGHSMKNGAITVEGSAQEEAGSRMAGGRLIILGNGGYRTGIGMTGGSLEVKKDAGAQVGCDMHGGTIRVHGNVGTMAGLQLAGGVLIIKGNVGNQVGRESEGGEIHIEGRIGSLSRDCKAQVFHKGIRIK